MICTWSLHENWRRLQYLLYGVDHIIINTFTMIMRTICRKSFRTLVVKTNRADHFDAQSRTVTEKRRAVLHSFREEKENKWNRRTALNDQKRNSDGSPRPFMSTRVSSEWVDAFVIQFENGIRTETYVTLYYPNEFLLKCPVQEYCKFGRIQAVHQ